ncbi:Calx-beta domain-containing protein [Desulfococcaceae bacterium HSG8]|nr:Calx-beta domain-containing protein [Desulfococcaceae bacterium HSG8]
MKRLKLLSVVISIVMVFFVMSEGSALGQTHEASLSWMPADSRSSGFFNNIWGTSGSDVFAVGGGYDYDALQYYGMILYYDGANWKEVHHETFQYIEDIWGTSESDVFAAGGVYGDNTLQYQGVILHYDGADWSLMNTGATGWLYGIWGRSGSDVFAVGDAGTILHYDGTGWYKINSGTDRNLRGVWGSSGSDVFVTGDSGIILHYNGKEWSEMPVETDKHLTRVWGISGSDVFVVGDAGTILHYDGAEWHEMSSSTDADLKGIWGNSGSDIYAAGDAGTILRYNGTGWQKMNSGTDQRIRGIWSSPGPDVFATGDFGTILRYLPLAIEVPPSVSEGDGILTARGTVRSVYAQGSDLTINLVSGDPSEISVPASVTIPKGRTSAVFDLTIMNDTLLDGSPKVTVTAAAADYSPAAAVVQVIDDETVALAISIPENAAEGDDILQGTVTVAAVVEKDVAISLVSDDTGEITVPEMITIPAGESAAVFDLTIVDDTKIDGKKTATVTASVAGWISGSDSVDVEDNELRELGIQFDTDIVSDEEDTVSVHEHEGLLSGAGIVSVPGTLVSDLTVLLSSDTPSEIVVPETVTIPSGEASAAFDLTVIEDSETDGPQTVTITALAEGWTSGNNTIDVNDNDPGTLEFSAESYEAGETDGEIEITVVRRFSTTGKITVDYATSDDTAIAGEDYTDASGTLVFEDGETSKTFFISVSDDALAEGDETVNLALGNPEGGVGEPSVLTIFDDEHTCLNADLNDTRIVLNWCIPYQSEDLLGYNVYHEGIRINTDIVTESAYIADVGTEYGKYAYTVKAVYETGEERNLYNEAYVVIAQDYALDFNGTDDYVAVPNNPVLRPDTAITLEAWIYVRSVDKWEGPISYLQDNSMDESGYGFFYKNEKLRFFLVTEDMSGNDASNNPGGSVTLNKWHHIAGTYDASAGENNLRFYLDGVLTDSETKTGNIDWTFMPTDFRIGVYHDDNEDEYFDGMIDEVRIWNAARTQEEIRSAIYNKLNDEDEELAGYWPMNERSVADMSGSGTDGTIHGVFFAEGVPLGDIARVPRFLKAVVGSDQVVQLTWRNFSRRKDLQGHNIYRDDVKIAAADIKTSEFSEHVNYSDTDVLSDNSYCYTVTAVYGEGGESGQSDEVCVDIASEYAMVYDGQDNYVQLDSANVLGLSYGNFTVEAWIRISSFDHIYEPVLGVSPLLFIGTRDRKPYMSFNFGESRKENENDLEGKTILSENVWYHIAWRYARTEGPVGEQAVFINGIPDASEKGHYVFQGAGNADIGRVRDSYFTGMIQEVRIWNTARTEEEIRSAMYSRLNGNEEGLAGWWLPDEWNIVTLADKSGNGHDGTINDLTYAKGIQIDQLAVIPQFLKAAGSDAGITLSWNPPGFADDLIGYRVRRDDGKTSEPEEIIWVKTSEVSQEVWHDADVSPGNSHCYTVEAIYDDSGESIPSDEVCMLAASDYALSFNGIDNYAGTSELSGSDFSADQSFTAELWVKPDESRNDPGIISNKDWDSGRNKGFIIAQVDDSWKANIGDNENRSDFSGSIIYDGKWHHLSIVIDRESGKMSVFQDGDMKGETDISSIGDLNSGLNLNIGQDGTGIYGDKFKGAIDEVRIWDRARTTEEIRSAMFTRMTGNEEGLAVYWPMNEVTPNRLPDKSGNSHDGEIYGAEWIEGAPVSQMGRIPLNLKAVPDPGGSGIRLTWETPGLTSGLSGYNILRDGVQSGADIITETAYIDTDVIFGDTYCYAVKAVYDDAVENSPSDEACAVIMQNYALDFDGDDYVVIQNNPILRPNTAITVEAWIYARSSGARRKAPISYLQDNGRQESGYGFFYKYDEIRIHLVTEDMPGEDVSDNPGSPITLNKWYHVAGTYDASAEENNLKFYLNGVLTDSETKTGNIDWTFMPDDFRIGVFHDRDEDKYFDGMIDEVRIWNAARTAEEIQATWNRGLSGNEEGLVGYWPMVPDETLTDKSGNGNHGKIYGAEWTQGPPIGE